MNNYVPLREVARFIWFLKIEYIHNLNNLQIAQIIDLCRERAGISSYSPFPEGALEFLEEIKMVQKIGQKLMLFQDCYDLVESSESPLYLNREQKEIIYVALLSHEDIGGQIRDVIAKCNITEDGFPAISVDSISWSGERKEWIIYLLQELDVLLWNGFRFILNKEELKLLDSSALQVVAMEESTLEEILLFQKKISRAAEDFIVEWEKNRLESQGDGHLVNLVRRVSSENVLLGYDVVSVEGGENGDMDRIIEVKSSCGTSLSFYWTLNEIECARKLGKNYWLYFVPRANILPQKRPCVYIIRNPESYLGKKLKYKEKLLHVWYEPSLKNLTRVDFGDGWSCLSF